MVFASEFGVHAVWHVTFRLDITLIQCCYYLFFFITVTNCIPLIIISLIFPYSTHPISPPPHTFWCFLWSHPFYRLSQWNGQWFFCFVFGRFQVLKSVRISAVRLSWFSSQSALRAVIQWKKCSEWRFTSWSMTIYNFVSFLIFFYHFINLFLIWLPWFWSPVSTNFRWCPLNRRFFPFTFRTFLILALHNLIIPPQFLIQTLFNDYVIGRPLLRLPFWIRWSYLSTPARRFGG